MACFSDPDRTARLKSALPEVERIFESFRSRQSIVGLAFGVVLDGDLVLCRGLGFQDRAAERPVTPGTYFRIASMTKSFTALAILRLRDEGRLSLEDPVARWIPEAARWRPPYADTAPLRVRQLLTHGAGFPEDNPWGDRQLNVTEEAFSRWLRQGLPFSTAPDTAYEYSNYGFALLGRIVAKASGLTCRAYLERKILQPLGMRSTTLEPSSVPEKLRALGYRPSADSFQEEPPLADGAFGPMGGLLTTAEDMGKYVAFHLSAWPPRDDPDPGPVRRSSLREMQRAWRTDSFSVRRTSPEEPVRAASSGYGYGLRISADCRFRHIVGHGGGLPGYGSYMVWLPEYGVGIFAMDNLTYASPRAACDEVFDLLRKTGALQPRRLPASPALEQARSSLLRLWARWDDPEARQLAADNLFLDTPAEDRRLEIETMKKELGACRADGEILAENLLRGAFRLSCEKGAVQIVFTLAPTHPPRIQHLQITADSSSQTATKGPCPGP